MSDSAGTLWLNVAERRWDATLLAACGLTQAQMPRLVEGSQVSACLSAQVAAEWGLAGRKIPIAGGGGDNALPSVSARRAPATVSFRSGRPGSSLPSRIIRWPCRSVRCMPSVMRSLGAGKA